MGKQIIPPKQPAKPAAAAVRKPLKPAAAITTTPTPSPWAAMYNALQSTLGLSSSNFQLLTPMQLWNWPVANSGQTSAEQQSFLDNMPLWNAVGQYISGGSSFSTAYGTWLQTLLVQAPSTIQNDITTERNLLQTASNQYQTDYAAALAAYQSDPTVSNNNPPFTTWLTEGKGASYGPTLATDLDQINQLTATLTKYISESSDPVLTSATAAYSNTAYYTNVVTSSTGSPISEPGYSQITDYATWLSQQAGTGSQPITWSNSQSASISSSNFSQTAGAVDLGFFGVYVDNAWQSLSDLETNSNVQVTLTFNPWGVIDVTPLLWYQDSTVQAKVNNAQAYIPGYAPTQTEAGTGAWVTGQGGIMPARMTSFLVCYQPSFSISCSSGFSSSDYQAMQSAGGILIGPFAIGEGSSDSSSSMKITQQSQNTFSGTSTSQFPYIFGVELEVFGS